MSTKASPYIIGVPVPPSRFYGYGDQVAQFFRQCICEATLQPNRVLGLRRSGKTSFLKYISSTYVPDDLFVEVTRDDLLFAYLNLEYVSSPREFFLGVTEAIREKCTAPDFQAEEPALTYAFSKWLKKFLSVEKTKKLILLLDEFDKIQASKNFEQDFFGFLRSLASDNAERLTWVTASVIDLHTLDKNEKTSPLWNIFHNTPIIMGGLEAEAAESLVRKPAQRHNVKFTKTEVSEILLLAGKVPYFIQAVAAEWFQHKSESHSLSETRDQVIEKLTNPKNQVQKILNGYWEHMSAEKRIVLIDIAASSRITLRYSSAYKELIEYGLIWENHSGVKIAGELWKQYILRAAITDQAKPRVATQPSDPIAHAERKGGAPASSTYFYIENQYGEINQVNETGIDARQVEDLFKVIFAAVDSHPRMGQPDKTDIKVEVEEVRQELAKQEKVDQTALERHLRNIGRMAPDILEVTLATITNPIAGFGVVAKKVAEKMRSSAG